MDPWEARARAFLRAIPPRRVFPQKSACAIPAGSGTGPPCRQPIFSACMTSLSVLPPQLRCNRWRSLQQGHRARCTHPACSRSFDARWRSPTLAWRITTMKTPLRNLEAWFRSHCNGDWEHSEGIRIATLDNPGWAVDIDLRGTELEGQEAPVTKDERSEIDWVHCCVRDGRYVIRCGPTNLEEGLSVFLHLASRLGRRPTL